MTNISTVGAQTRLDIQELLSQFSHSIDYNFGERWASLFTVDGFFEWTGGNILRGTAELTKFPQIVFNLGHGGWRHIITAVVIERTNNPKDLLVHAYCPVMDISQSNALAAFFDLQMNVRYTSRWCIQNARATRVGSLQNHYLGIAL